MDGLLLAEQLALLEPLLPTARGAWRFPDSWTAVLPLPAGATLWLAADPHAPWLAVRSAEQAERPRSAGAGPARPRGSAGTQRTPFQTQLAARATGDLIAAQQSALDRVVRFSFGEGEGFVPERPVDLIVELTGRNANLILVGSDGRVLGAQRMVTAEHNRHREIRPGARYVPPPPYDKLDPRSATAADLRERLAGGTLRDVRQSIDGVGKSLYQALVGMLAPVAQGEPLQGPELDRAVAALQELASAPGAALRLAAQSEHDDADAAKRAVAERRSLAEKRLAKLMNVAAKRVADARLALTAAEDAGAIRAEADLLLARAASFAPAGSAVELTDFDSRPVRLDVDPSLGAAGNAAQRYDRARRKEARAQRATDRLPELAARLAELSDVAAALAGADLAALKRIESWLTEAEGPGGAQALRSREKTKEQTPGVRFVDPRGFEVLVGRSARENDAITFGVAKSRDTWLHVQGYQGAHVLVRAKGREVPFDTVLFAARLAAGFSRAKGSDNVAVDYTERKNVWHAKGAPPGAVHIAHQKTVYVTPARSDADAAGGDPD